MDIDDRLVFPPEILSTSQRPDVVIWSTALKKVILIELTCPAEEGIDAARIRKETWYMALMNKIKDSGWSARLWTVEVGARGFVGRSFLNCVGKLDISNQESWLLYKAVSITAAKCS